MCENDFQVASPILGAHAVWFEGDQVELVVGMVGLVVTFLLKQPDE